MEIESSKILSIDSMTEKMKKIKFNDQDNIFEHIIPWGIENLKPLHWPLSMSLSV